jgi:hemoglobin-like flavoprotein
MTTKQIELVKSTWAIVATIDAVAVGNLFYNRLFEIAPQVKHMFRNPMEEQSKKLISMITYVIRKLDKLDDIIDEVGKLAKRHVQYGVEPEHYLIVGNALIWTLAQGLGKYWSEEVREAWAKCYSILSNAMIEASYHEPLAEVA